MDNINHSDYESRVQQMLLVVMMNPGDIGNAVMDSGETNSEQNGESQDTQALITFGSAQPADMISILSTHTLPFPASQPVEVEPHDTGPTVEIPFARTARLFGPADDFVVQFSTQVQVVSPAMDLDLYLATRPYDRETTAELLVESPDLLPVEVAETTVNEEPHIQADIGQIPGEHIVNVIVEINTENEGINNLPDIIVSAPETPAPIEDDLTNESVEFERLPSVGPVGNSEQIDTPDIDSPVLHHPELQQPPATSLSPLEAVDPTPAVTIMTENSRLTIDTAVHLAVPVSPLTRERRSKSSMEAQRFHFNDNRRNSYPETKFVHQTNRNG